MVSCDLLRGDQHSQWSAANPGNSPNCFRCRRKNFFPNFENFNHVFSMPVISLPLQLPISLQKLSIYKLSTILFSAFQDKRNESPLGEMPQGALDLNGCIVGMHATLFSFLQFLLLRSGLNQIKNSGSLYFKG